MDSFARLDTNASKEVIIEDEKVDQEYEQILKHGLDNMKENPEEVKRLMNVTWAARALERIGDHAKNISEYVVYMVEGKKASQNKNYKIRNTHSLKCNKFVIIFNLLRFSVTEFTYFQGELSC